MPDICGIIIPVYQNFRYLPELLQKIQKIQSTLPAWDFHVLVIDDGSIPPIPHINVKGLKLAYLRHPENRGKGAALKTGFHFFMEKRNVNAILTMDGDLQHPPEAVPMFLWEFQCHQADMVYGYRSRKIGVMPLHRIASNYLTSLIISLFTGRICRDSQCGFRLYRKAALRNVPMQENRFHLESELALRLGWRKAKMVPVRIPTIYNHSPSAIRNLPDTLNFVALVVKLVFRRLWGHV